MSLFDQKKNLEGVTPGARRKDEEFEAAMLKFGEDPAREWDSFTEGEQAAIHAQARGFKEVFFQVQNGTAQVDPQKFIQRFSRILQRAADAGA